MPRIGELTRAFFFLKSFEAHLTCIKCNRVPRREEDVYSFDNYDLICLRCSGKKRRENPPQLEALFGAFNDLVKQCAGRMISAAEQNKHQKKPKKIPIHRLVKSFIKFRYPDKEDDTAKWPDPSSFIRPKERVPRLPKEHSLPRQDDISKTPPTTSWELFLYKLAVIAHFSMKDQGLKLRLLQYGAQVIDCRDKIKVDRKYRLVLANPSSKKFELQEVLELASAVNGVAVDERFLDQLINNRGEICIKKYLISPESSSYKGKFPAWCNNPKKCQKWHKGGEVFAMN